MTLITRTLVERRTKDPLNKKRVLKVIDTCNTFSDKTRLPFIFNGRQYNTYSSHKDILDAWAKMETQYSAQGPAFILTTDKDHPFFALAPREDPYGIYNDDAIEFSFSTEKPLLNPGGYFSFKECLEFFKATINAYEAYCAYIHDNELEELIASSFTIKNMKMQLPEDQWKYIPAPELAGRIPAHIIESITRVVSPEQFDRLEIPEAIYWFNYWNEFQVEKVGEEKIKSAPCEFIEKQKNGGYILVSQKENLDASNVSHMERIAALYEHFNLYEIQERNKFSE